MNKEDKADIRNQNLMNIIKRLHVALSDTDLEKTRASQDHVAHLQIPPKNLSITEFEIDGMYAEWIKPNNPHPQKNIILYCHGGGYTTGSPLYSRSVTYKLATATNLEVLCFAYRLSPEHPYPAAYEDALKVWDYLMLLGYGAHDVYIIGDSAGGNLALSLSLQLRDAGRMLPKSLVLLSPWTDLTKSGSSYKSKVNLDPVLSIEYMDAAIERFAPKQDLNNPYISPIFGDYTDFPPVLIQVGSNEILYSDSSHLAKQLQKSGVNVTLDVYKGMWHVFQMTPLKTAYEAVDKIADFIYKNQ